MKWRLPVISVTSPEHVDRCCVLNGNTVEEVLSHRRVNYARLIPRCDRQLTAGKQLHSLAF